jgi:epoxyqueuosine reductase
MHADFFRDYSGLDLRRLAEEIKTWGVELGFQAVGIAGVDLGGAESELLEWLGRGFHGEMDYMARHGVRRSRPAELVPGTVRVISARMNYLPRGARDGAALVQEGRHAFISRYALGRDYHKVVRGRLQKLADRIRERVGEFRYRVFSDSAPVMEVELASRAGTGWRGKHSLLLSRDAGSWFFLGEIYTDLPLPADHPEPGHCGTCAACIKACPTGAIVAPYRVDARRCISYLTIELKGNIPEALRPLIGNRIYGCDDCQLVCPWNQRAPFTGESDFAVRNGLDDVELLALFRWTEEEFRKKLAGSPILRIGFERWQRNIAVALGNAPADEEIAAALREKLDHPSEIVREHVAWALARQDRRS